jgi:hypothetical protein
MTDQPDESLTDEDMTTTYAGPADAPQPGGTTGTTGADGDGTDGADADGTDGGDADGTDGVAGDGTVGGLS